VQHLPSSTAGSSQVYTLDPPIPGSVLYLVGNETAAVLVKTANSETFRSSEGSSHTTIDIPVDQIAMLIGVTTGVYGTVGMSTAAGFAYSTST